ncbi:MAG: TonB-dependent receptor plug domain-containing protein, partial [Muribaculaceae bacterium]
MKPSRWILLISLFATALPLWAQTDSIDVDTLYQTQELQSVVVSGSTGNRSRYSIMNAEIIGQQQLVRAACCNLGESFTTNPSVDVNYSDAATGARQIRLLGLSGTYVQMMTENVPNFRGASIPYSLGYVPGPWMQSVQVSKGAASVKNGYESLTGQINIEYKKPQATDGIRGNAYFDSKLRQEVNADGSIHISDALSASLLAHVENRQTDHDANGDGFLDMPKLKQYNLMNRWAYVTPGFISQLYVSMLGDERTSGMSSHSHAHDIEYYGVSVETKRYDLQWKNAFILNSDHNTSIALMLHGTLHDSDNMFGHTLYDVNQNTAYAQLMFESDINEMHNIAAGLSLNHDYFKEVIDGTNIAPGIDHNSETTSGAYLQYTFKPNEKIIVMPGIRWDYSNVYNGFFTPRLHIKYSPISELSLRASAGLGYRSPHALAENTPLLATGRTYIIANDLQQEKSFNWG